MKLTNIHNIPAPICEMIARDEYSRGGARISVTQLIDAPQIRVLREQHEDDIVQDVSERLHLLIGKAVHKYAESMTSPHRTNEQRFFGEFSGWLLSGAIDVQEYEDRSIGINDYKCTKVDTLRFDKPLWAAQLNVYAHLAEMQGLTVRSLEIWAIMVDWSKGKAGRDRDYPQCGMKTIPVPLWPFAERERYIQERMAIHQFAQMCATFGDPLPECTPEERWVRGEKWAVMKGKATKALRLFDERIEAEVYALDRPGSRVQHRPGESKRCASWCLVARWCDQRQKELFGIAEDAKLFSGENENGRDREILPTGDVGTGGIPLSGGDSFGEDGRENDGDGISGSSSGRCDDAGRPDAVLLEPCGGSTPGTATELQTEAACDHVSPSLH